MKSLLMGIALTCIMVSLSDAAAPTAEALPELVARGAYLATAGDCAACHRDTQSDHPLAGGYGIQSPMGVIYASNITPSTQYGIGRYSLAEFIAVMREGKAPGGRYLYPAMPYTAFAGMSDRDLQALYSYLMLAVKPVDHQVPQTDLPFPFSFRPVMRLWNALYLDSRTIPGSEAAGGSVERGEYLVRTLTHCSTCHTPRNTLMAEQQVKFLSGSQLGGWVAPNITPDPQAGIGQWSEQQLVTYLQTGAVHGLAIAGGEMGTAVQNSFSKLNEEDLQAIARYLKSLPAIQGAARHHSLPADNRNTQVSFETGLGMDAHSLTETQSMSGAQLYNGACATCHGSDGKGTPDPQHFYPALVGSSAVTQPNPANLIMTIAEGIDRKTPSGHAFMPEFTSQFTPEQLARVAEFVTQNFGGNRATQISAQQVREAMSGVDNSHWLIKYAALLTYGGMAVLIIILLLVVTLVKRRVR